MSKHQMFFGGAFIGAGIASLGFGGYYIAYLLRLLSQDLSAFLAG